MNSKKNLKIISISLLLFIALSVMPFFSNAATASYTYISPDGNLTVTMSKSVITIDAESHAASTNIRWRTIGINLTRNKIESEIRVKNEKGPGAVSDAGKSYYLPYEGHVIYDNTVGNTNYKRIRFSKELVEATLGEDFSTLKQGTIIYMHAVFQTYDNDTNVIRHTSLRNWESIMNAETWGTDTLTDFEKYYNMPIPFATDKQPNTLMYHSATRTGPTLKECKTSPDLPEQLPGDAVEWNEWDNRVLTTNLDNKIRTYDLMGYEVYSKKGDKLIKKLYVKDILNMDQVLTIANNFENEVMGGLNIYLIYKIRLGPNVPSLPPGPTQIPVPTKAVPTATPTPIVVPESETVSVELPEPVSVGTIRADDRGSEKFTVTDGVPTTESLFTQVQSDQWLMGYKFQKQVGLNTYSVRATKKYILKWKVNQLINGVLVPTEKTATKSVTQTVSIQRAYGYWEILNFDYYMIGSTTINNYALPDGSTTMTPDYSKGYSPPSESINHSSKESEHIFVPGEIIGGVTLNSVTLNGEFSKPRIPSEDFTSEADSKIPELTVKNDSLVLNGTKVMNSTPAKKEGPDVDKGFMYQIRQEGTDACNENILYKPGQVIQDIKKNGTYNSSGTITYQRVKSVNSSYNQTIKNTLINLSTVVIHTPVLCNPIVNADNNKYVQLLHPTNATQLVLDPNPALNDFTLNISNYGHHSYKIGYYTRDFSYCLRDPAVSYLASQNGLLLNEVKFPFDVFVKESSGDKFVAKNTWIITGRNTVTFHLPMWVLEGTYTADCRSIAVNADMSKLEQISENYVNSELFNYVATNSFKVEVSGRLYGLSIYDLTDYPLWKEAFLAKQSLDFKINNRAKYPDGTDKLNYNKNYSYNYTVGTKDQYGNSTKRYTKYTFPLVNGDHPFYKNVGILKTGYIIRFTLDTIGNMYSERCHIKIKPSFYFVDKEGKNRTAVDLYYSETIDGESRNLIKMGNSLDQINMKEMEVGSPYTGIPKVEMKQTAAILGMKYSTFITKRDTIFNFKDIRIPATFRTFINNAYTKSIQDSDQYTKIKEAGITQDLILKQMQSWYGCYYLPGILHAAPQGYDVYGYAQKYGVQYTEDFWKKDGYIIVNFDIVTVDNEGKERLSYINGDNYLNNANNCMWTMEGAPLMKQDNSGIFFNFKAGDFFIYYADKSVHDDTRAGGIY